MLKNLQAGHTPGIRIQLTLWYTGVFALLILLFSLIFYTILQTLLTSGVDATLQLRTQQIAAGISSENGKVTIQDITGELPGMDNSTPPGEQSKNTVVTSPPDTQLHGVKSDVNIGILVRMLDTKGQTIYISPAFHALAPPASSVTQALQGTPWQGIVKTQTGQAVRVDSVALSDGGVTFGVLQVGESLAQLTTTLQNITLALLIIAPFVFLLAALGSYWLAKRAFRPMLHLTRTAREIKAGDLHRRVPVPSSRDEIYDLAQTLNEMIGRLDQAFTQQRRFVADASHELRTPVTVIRSIADVALQEPLERMEYIEALHDISAEGERLSQLLNALLMLARTDEGRLTLDHEAVRLDLLALDVAASMQPLALERAVQLQVQALEPITVLGDTAHLIQVLMGLVDNALTYTNAGGTVTLRVGSQMGNACLTICDTGIGIAEKDIVHIFERFYRADPARTQAAGGSGLGLSIASWIVREHGGSIHVESQPGQGSTFSILLPLVSAAPVTVHRQALLTKGAGSPTPPHSRG